MVSDTGVPDPTVSALGVCASESLRNGPGWAQIEGEIRQVAETIMHHLANLFMAHGVLFIIKSTAIVLFAT